MFTSKEGSLDKIMKVVKYESTDIVEINVTEITMELLSQVTKYADLLAREKDLPHFQCSIGIPTFAELEKNLVEYFTKYNKTRVQQLAEELEIELPKFDWSESNKQALELAKENLKCDNAHEIANGKMIKGAENLKTNQAAISIQEQMKRICP